ncbi:FAD-dependent oxidoreductase [Actinoplanes sp. CA-131856]
MAFMRTDVVIVGAGVIGLTTAARLAERRPGVRISIYADHLGHETSSYAAGAIFDPHMAEHPRRDLWARMTHAELHRWHLNGEPWVRFLHGVEASRTHLASPPSWALDLPGYRECDPADLPAGFVTGWHYEAPLVDMPLYLDWLGRRSATAEVSVHRRHLETLEEAFDSAAIVVNCSGIGASSLVPDGSMQPMRGQLVKVSNPGIHEFFVEYPAAPDMGESTYILPQGDSLLLGGNAEKGEPEPVPDPVVAAGILERCRGVFPQLASAGVLEHRVGIRPRRSEVRLEHDDLGDRHIVHNYGHGGSGVSLAWGCADDVADIVLGLLDASIGCSNV